MSPQTLQEAGAPMDLISPWVKPADLPPAAAVTADAAPGGEAAALAPTPAGCGGDGADGNDEEEGRVSGARL